MNLNIRNTFKTLALAFWLSVVAQQAIADTSNKVDNVLNTKKGETTQISNSDSQKEVWFKEARTNKDFKMDFSKLDNQNKIPAKNSVKLSTEKVNKKAVWGLDYTYNNGKTWVKATVKAGKKTKATQVTVAHREGKIWGKVTAWVSSNDFHWKDVKQKFIWAEAKFYWDDYNLWVYWNSIKSDSLTVEKTVYKNLFTDEEFYSKKVWDEKLNLVETYTLDTKENHSFTHNWGKSKELWLTWEVFLWENTDLSGHFWLRNVKDSYFNGKTVTYWAKVSHILNDKVEVWASAEKLGKKEFYYYWETNFKVGPNAEIWARLWQTSFDDKKEVVWMVSVKIDLDRKWNNKFESYKKTKKLDVEPVVWADASIRNVLWTESAASSTDIPVPASSIRLISKEPIMPEIPLPPTPPVL